MKDKKTTENLRRNGSSVTSYKNEAGRKPIVVDKAQAE